MANLLISVRDLTFVNEGLGTQQDKFESNTLPIFGGSGTSGEFSQQEGGSFTADSSIIQSVAIDWFRTGSPADNIIIKITSTLGGTALGTITVSAASIDASSTLPTLAFPTPITVTPGNVYNIEISRSGARDTVNYLSHGYQNATNPYSGGDLKKKDNNTWIEDTNSDLTFRINYFNPTVVQVDNVNNFDTSTVTENVSVVVPTYFINVNDTSAVTESITVNEVHNINKFDSSTVTNVITTINAPTVKPVNVNDSSTVTESSTVLMRDNINVFDSSAVTESATIRADENIFYGEKVDQSNLTGGVGIGFGDSTRHARGQGFKPTFSTLTAIAFKMNSTGSQGFKLFIDTADSNSLPTHTFESGALYSFEITNAQLSTSLTKYSLPVPLTVTPGNQYCFYLQPWDTTNHVYADDYRDMDSSVSNPYANGNQWQYDPTVPQYVLNDSGNADSVFQTYGFSGDSSAVTEAVTMLVRDNINVFDSSAVTESTTLAISLAVTVNDSSSVTEQIQAQLSEEEVLYDATTVTELVQMALTSFVAVNDVSSVTESLTVSTDNNIVSSDAVAVLESASLLLIGELQVSVFDSSTVTESINVTSSIALAINDSSTVTEQAIVIPTIGNISLSDSSIVIDTVTVNQTYNLSVNDSSIVTDILIQEQEDLDIMIAESSNVTDMLNGQNNGMYLNPLDMNLYEQIGGAYKFIILDGRIAMQLTGNQYTIL